MIGDKDGPEIDRQAERHCPRHLPVAPTPTGTTRPEEGTYAQLDRTFPHLQTGLAPLQGWTQRFVAAVVAVLMVALSGCRQSD